MAHDVFQNAPADSHLEWFRLPADSLAVHVRFREKRGARGQVYPAATYEYLFSDAGQRMAVWNALCAASSPGEVVDRELIKKGNRGRKL